MTQYGSDFKNNKSNHLKNDGLSQNNSDNVPEVSNHNENQDALSPWSVKGIRQDTKETTKKLASQYGKPMGTFLNDLIYQVEQLPIDKNGIHLNNPDLSKDIITNISKTLHYIENKSTKLQNDVDERSQKYNDLLNKLIEQFTIFHQKLQKLEKNDQEGNKQDLSNIAFKINNLEENINDFKPFLEQLESNNNNLNSLENKISNQDNVLNKHNDSLAQIVSLIEKIQEKLSKNLDVNTNENLHQSSQKIQALGNELRRQENLIGTIQTHQEQILDAIESTEERSAQAITKLSNEFKRSLNNKSNNVNLEKIDSLIEEKLLPHSYALKEVKNDIISRLNSQAKIIQKLVDKTVTNTNQTTTNKPAKTDMYKSNFDEDTFRANKNLTNKKSISQQMSQQEKDYKNPSVANEQETTFPPNSPQVNSDPEQNYKNYQKQQYTPRPYPMRKNISANKAELYSPRPYPLRNKQISSTEARSKILRNNNVQPQENNKSSLPKTKVITPPNQSRSWSSLAFSNALKGRNSLILLAGAALILISVGGIGFFPGILTRPQGASHTIPIDSLLGLEESGNDAGLKSLQKQQINTNKGYKVKNSQTNRGHQSDLNTNLNTNPDNLNYKSSFSDKQTISGTEKGRKTISGKQVTLINTLNNEDTFLNIYRKYSNTKDNDVYKSLLPEFKNLAENSHVKSQYILAQMYQNGLGTRPSNSEARKWYALAADGGNVEAMYTVANFLIEETDFDSAIYYYQLAAQYNHIDSQFNLGSIYLPTQPRNNREDPQKAYFYFTLAANNGDQEASNFAKELEKLLSANQIRDVGKKLATFNIKSPSRNANILN